MSSVALQLKWIRCSTGKWCGFDQLDLDSVDTVGVYVIWHEAETGRWVYVGQGDVADRLSAHRRNPAITRFRDHGRLYVSWAEVDPRRMDGVERFLAEKLNPIAGEAWPDVPPIVVNVPA